MRQNIVIIVFISFFFFGCSQKVNVKSLVPAKVSNNAVKKTTLGKFKSDSVALKSNIYSSMDNVIFQDKKYFTMVNRDDIDTILKEQELQDSGLVNDTKEGFLLTEVDSIISGEVIKKTNTRNFYYKESINYNRCLAKNQKGQCIRYAKRKIRCEEEKYFLSAQLKITDVHTTNVIFVKQFDKSNSIDSCYRSGYTPASEVFNSLSKQIASEFVAYISPQIVQKRVELLDDEDIKYNKKQSKLLENGLKLIKLNDFKNAKAIFEQLVQSTNNSSSTALYNLGVVYEILGELTNAKTSYNRAKNITLQGDMNELIIKANKHIEETILNNNKARQQIENTN